MSSFLRVAGVAALSLALLAPAAAEQYPSRPITIVVPFAVAVRSIRPRASLPTR